MLRLIFFCELMIKTNYLGLVSIFGEIANRMEKRGSGTIIGVSSVAGDRGRASNYIYGSAKAGFAAFLSGLRNRLFQKNVRVITVKPGFVRTKMTEGLDLPGMLTASPDELAHAIHRADRKNKLVVYYRPVWRLIMLIWKSSRTIFVHAKNHNLFTAQPRPATVQTRLAQAKLQLLPA